MSHDRIGDALVAKGNLREAKLAESRSWTAFGARAAPRGLRKPSQPTPALLPNGYERRLTTAASRSSTEPDPPPCQVAYSDYLKHPGSTPPQGKHSALEKASETDSTASGEARQRSKSRSRIPKPEGGAAYGAMLELDAGQHRASSSAPRHEAISGRSQSQAGVGADYAWHGLAMDGGQEDMRPAVCRASSLPRSSRARQTSALCLSGRQLSINVGLMLEAVPRGQRFPHRTKPRRRRFSLRCATSS